MSVYDYIVLAIVGAAFAVAVIYMIKRRKKGSCHGSCGSCPYSSDCNKKR